MTKATGETDEKDFDAALAAGRIKPPDPAGARAQHVAARKYLDALDPKAEAGPMPDEFDSEFADYHRGARAYRLGPAHWDDAKAAWEKLLARPAAERRDRTVWATFMLGKIAMNRDQPEGAEWFRRVRAAAKDGFSDSLGMAADSYGWEARCEWRTGHPEKAAPLYLTQLAMGDESAIYSLKVLIPDRVAVDGRWNYGDWPGEPKDITPEMLEAIEKKLRAAEADPLLRRLVTVHILATATTDWALRDDVPRTADRSVRWLKLLKEARLGTLEDAEYLGWLAYTAGDYATAGEWLALAKADAPAACWLRAKLQRRAGQIGPAAASMAQAFRAVRAVADYTHWPTAPGTKSDEPSEEFLDYHEGFIFNQAAGGDLGALRLERADFLGALTAFLQGRLWDDAAYVAERVLTLDELRKFVGDLDTAGIGETAEQRKSLRYLLGRRLVRANRFAEAAAYLPEPYPAVLAKYVQDMKDGANAKLPKAKRARAWFSAAWTARVDGMELMGTEVAPDGFTSEGAFPNSDIAGERLSGKLRPRWDAEVEPGKPVPKPVAITARPAAQEKERLRRNRITPEIRFHYRVLAGALAMRAAALLPNDSEELADVINRAGLWVKERDEKVADRYFEELRRRAAKARLGRVALEKKWFVDEAGPWSQEELAMPRERGKPKEE